MSVPVKQTTAVVAAPPEVAAGVVSAPPRRSVPWGWIVGGIIGSIVAAMLLTVVIGAIIFEIRRGRRRPDATPFLPVTPVGPRGGVPAPVGVPLPAGRYKILWGSTGLYLGAGATADSPAVLVAAAAAPTWTYAEATATGGVAGSFTLPTGSALSTGTATALVGPVPVYVGVPATTATGSWVPARDTVGGNAVPGSIYNVALGGCLRPDGNAGVGSRVVLAPSCSVAERGWLFESVNA
ncbi:hypothetical protein pdul_cds_536 [Pandoravirus dulcis]|uniref:Uncharacterized protein n=1 Tax=Pandoravirus dulcis TaxID=1349409 RepID=S4VQT3_9VIRU|nr:hypothetical protein pdul_cds_536 [Pandoravirus dulcis]AGO82637.1 hypothetical protein pdul_cds_536 [Pandoravirus dulcis]